MSHLLVKIVDFEIVGPYTLRIIFDDGEKRTINFEPVLHGHYYGPLRDPSVFNKVILDPEISTLVWPNDADFDPATLYNWDQGEGEELVKRVTSWQKASTKITILESI
jgi:hypothetical protein